MEGEGDRRGLPRQGLGQDDEEDGHGQQASRYGSEWRSRPDKADDLVRDLSCGHRFTFAAMAGR